MREKRCMQADARLVLLKPCGIGVVYACYMFKRLQPKIGALPEDTYCRLINVSIFCVGMQMCLFGCVWPCIISCTYEFMCVKTKKQLQRKSTDMGL